ncbi:MAG: photosystem stability/assembly factor-like protein [Nevskia sp.]|nr:photosystem stability/assembly factor-like protein [Nevskia sp.]
MKNLLKMMSLVAAAAAAVALSSAASATAQPSSGIEVITSGTAHQALFAIAFDGQDGVAVGAAGEIQETADSGKSWKRLDAAPTPLALLGVTINQGHRIAVGQSGTVLTKDAGGPWTKVDAGTPGRLFSVSLNSKGRAVAVGEFGTVIKSEDGGKTWTTLTPDWKGVAEEGVQPHLYAVTVDEDGSITMLGEFGMIQHSTDDGASWKLVHKGDASLFAIHVRSDGVGYAVGQASTVLRTVDHGASWTEANSGGGAVLLGVRSSPSGKVFVTGMRDMMLSDDDGKTWRHGAGADLATTWYQGISIPTGTDTVLAVGHNGRIIRIGG